MSAAAALQPIDINSLRRDLEATDPRDVFRRHRLDQAIALLAESHRLKKKAAALLDTATAAEPPSRRFGRRGGNV